ncbi:hypothetical protein SAMN05444350_112103 [Bacteroides stercorirosoris]|uniref:Uncharacterized protein n=2 Tax=Bacteroides TaxID=816 RepID=A0A1M6FLV1_9BACE|nr:hypothetical protein SAMN05444350_112103 [Bacteroides stercorirosoris]
MRNNQTIIIFVMSNNKSNNMSNEQIKKDLLIQRAFLKKELDQLRFISEVTGTNQEKEIDKRLDRILTIDKILAELEKKK